MSESAFFQVFQGRRGRIAVFIKYSKAGEGVNSSQNDAEAEYSEFIEIFLKAGKGEYLRIFTSHNDGDQSLVELK